MDLQTAVIGMMDAQSKLRSKQGINSPAFMSEMMMRLAQYTGAVEENLANYEQEYEIKQAQLYKKYLLDNSATAAERLVRTDLAEEKGQIAYLSRIVSSAWKQVGVIQSRYNHIEKSIAGQS